MNVIEVVSLSDKYKSLEPKLKKLVSSSLKSLSVKDVYLEIFLVSNQKMRYLNKKFRAKDKATNVLSFPLASNFFTAPRGPKPIGEIYLAPDYISEKKEDIQFLCVHGLLHLFGYDHKKSADRIKMEKKEKELYV